MYVELKGGIKSEIVGVGNILRLMQIINDDDDVLPNLSLFYLVI